MAIKISPANITIAYEEILPAPSEDFDEEGKFSAVRNLKCAFADRLKLRKQLCGYTLASEDGAVDNLQIFQPHEYPHYPGAFASSVRMQHFGLTTAHQGDTKVIGFDSVESYSVLSVTYKPFKSVGGQPTPGGGPAQIVLQETLTPASEFLTVGATDLSWTPEGGGEQKPITDIEAPGLLIPMREWGYRLTNLKKVHPDFLNLEGSVNAGSIASKTLGLTFAAETLLFRGGTPDFSFDDEGNVSISLAASFMWKKSGWNKFFRAGVTTAASLYRVGDSSPYLPYPTANFSKIVV